jgi:hypothetical protein
MFDGWHHSKLTLARNPQLLSLLELALLAVRERLPVQTKIKRIRKTTKRTTRTKAVYLRQPSLVSVLVQVPPALLQLVFWFGYACGSATSRMLALLLRSPSPCLHLALVITLADVIPSRRSEAM